MEPIPPHRTPLSDTPYVVSRNDVGGNKIERIARHSKGLIDDVTSWVDLKLKHTQLEVRETIGKAKAEAIEVAGLLVFFGLCGLFLLITIALGLGWLLGHPFWGFLIVTVVLGLVGYAFKKAAPSIRHRMTAGLRVIVSEDHLEPADPMANSIPPVSKPR